MSENILEPEKCFEIIRKKLCSDSMDDFSFTYEFEPRQKFIGFMGQYFNLKVTLVNRNTSEVQKLNFFMKMLPIRGALYDYAKETGFFKTELGLYLKIFPKILTSRDSNFIPECFLGQEDHALVLEDMNFKGYKMMDKLQFLQLEHFLIIVKNLARFHARSVIFEESNRITVMELCNKNDILINKCDHFCQSALDRYSKNLISMVDLIIDIDFEKKEECKAEIARISSQHYEKTAPSTKFRNVLCHSDLWSNNILFKHNEINGRIEECCFVDFQAARYCSPVYDLLYFIYCTTSKEFRREHSIEILFSKYYKSLTKSLKEAQIDVTEIFSWNNLIESVTEIKLSCMIHAFAKMSIALLGCDASDQFIKEILPISKILCKELRESKEYRERMLDNMLDLCDHLLNQC